MRRVLPYLLIPMLALCDQLSKWWVMEKFFRPRAFEATEAAKSFGEWFLTLSQTPFPAVRFEVSGFFNLVMVWNTGVSFGMFSDLHAVMPYALSGLALLMCAGFLVWMARTPHLSVSLPLSMVTAGALANVWDRARFGGVADFLDFHIGDTHYPAFNLADSLIVLGVLWLAFDGVVLAPKREQNLDKRRTESADNPVVTP